MVAEPQMLLPEDISRRLPVEINSVEQYWGSLVKICGEDIHGKSIYFRLLYCDWTIFLNKIEIATSSETHSENKKGLGLLVGSAITDFTVDPTDNIITIICSNHIQISLAANLSTYEDDEQILLVCFPEAYISYCPKLGLIAEPRSPSPP